MRSIFILGGVVAMAFASMGCQPAAEAPVEEAATEPAPMSDEDMIEAQIDQFEQAWAAGDAGAIGDLFAPDGNMVGPAGESYDGREAIVERYRGLFDGMYQGTSVTLNRTSTRFPQPEVAIVDGTFEITGMKSADGAEASPIQGYYTNVAVKQGGEWRLHSSRPMIPVKAPGT